MPKPKSVYVCQQCGAQSPKWLGRCPACESWNTLVEETVEREAPAGRRSGRPASKPVRLADVTAEDADRLSTGLGELDRVLGGGLVAGSVVLVGGEPGIGKSTLLLSMAGSVASRGGRVLYVSGEESLRQTKLRASRLNLGGAEVYLLAQTSLEGTLEALHEVAPQVVIIDSIQVMEHESLGSAPGSVGQVRACAHALVEAVKQTNTALVIVGHITKEGFLAGPKVLEHLVDAVLYFEGDPTSGFRLLRCSKNRFGATHELGVFHMTGDGLVEVPNPSELFLSDRAEAASGCMVTVALEGSRPLLAEVQALTCPCGIGLPRRRATGVDFNRVSMLLAVLERRVGLRQISQQDAFVSSLGGLNLEEPAADLAIAIAVASSLREEPARRTDVALGEVGLTGEVRPVSHLEQRLQEARRVGYTRCFLAAPRGLPRVPGVELIAVRHVREAVHRALGTGERRAAQAEESAAVSAE